MQASICSRRAPQAILCLFVFSAICCAQSPVITWHSDFVRGGESFLAIGDGIVAGNTKLWGVRLQDGVSVIPSANVVDIPQRNKAIALTVLQETSQSITAALPYRWSDGVYAVWAESEGHWSSPVFLNRAAPEWLFESEVEPGATLRIIGKNLVSPGVRPQVLIHSASGAMRELPIVKAEKYDLDVKIPDSLSVGAYTIYISNGRGGSYGWGDPLAVHLVQGHPWPQKVFNVKMFGARGDQDADDSTAVLAAIRAAGVNGGGVVYFPRGIYRITQMIRMPEKVVLRGESRDKVWLSWPAWQPGSPDPIPAIIVGERNFGIEDLSINFQMPRHGIIAPFDDKLAGQVDPFDQIGDQRLAASGGVFIRDCTIRHLRYAPRLTLGDRRLGGAPGQAGGVTVELAGDHVAVQDSDIVSWARPLVLLNVRHAMISGNTIGNGRNGGYDLSGAVDTIFENNVIMADDLEGSGGSINRNFPGRFPLHQVYVAHNRYRHIFGDEREALTFDNTSPGPRRWLGRVTSSTADTTTLASANWTEHGMEGLQCLIVSGRGIGQFRTIEENGKNEIRLDSPWIVAPDASSVVDVLVLPHDVIAYANDFEDSSVGVQLYGASYNFVVDGNTSNRGGGFWGYATYYKPMPKYYTRIWKHLAPMYFAQFIDNTVKDGYVFDEGPSNGNINEGGMIGLAANPWTPDDMPITLGFGIVIQRNHLYSDAPIVVRTGFQSPQAPDTPIIRDVLVEGNQVQSVNEGIQIGPGTQSVVLRKNSFADVGRTLADHGIDTLNLDGNVTSATKTN